MKIKYLIIGLAIVVAIAIGLFIQREKQAPKGGYFSSPEVHFSK